MPIKNKVRILYMYIYRFCMRYAGHGLIKSNS